MGNKYKTGQMIGSAIPSSLLVLLFPNVWFRKKFTLAPKMQKEPKAEAKIHEGLFFMCRERCKGKWLRLGPGFTMSSQNR